MEKGERMSKCMIQDCMCEATITIPRTIGTKEIKEYIHVCEFHFNFLRQPEPFVSIELKESKRK